MIGLPGRDDESTASPEYALPATVAAAHLTASAAELARKAAVDDLADLTAVTDQLVAGQQHIAAALTRLADRVANPTAKALSRWSTRPRSRR